MEIGGMSSFLIVFSAAPELSSVFVGIVALMTAIVIIGAFVRFLRRADDLP